MSSPALISLNHCHVALVARMERAISALQSGARDRGAHTALWGCSQHGAGGHPLHQPLQEPAWHWGAMGRLMDRVPLPWAPPHTTTTPSVQPRPHLPPSQWENAAASFPFRSIGVWRTFIKISLLKGKMGSPFLLPSRAALTPLPSYENTQERGFFSA